MGGAREYKCSATGQITDRKGCYGRSSTPGFSQNFCTGKNGKACASPWMVCPVCVIQEEIGSKINESFIVVSGKGLCRFHLKNGVDARRNGNGGRLVQTEGGNGKGSTAQVAKKTTAKPAAVGQAKKKILSSTATFQQVVNGVLVEITLLPLSSGEAEKVISAKVDEILPYDKQPRKDFPLNAIEELARSLSSADQKQNVILVKIKTSVGNWKFMLVDGERRWRSAKKAEIKIIKGVLKEFSNERELYREAAIANDHREPLTEREEALKIKMMIEEFEMSIEEVADRLGISSVTARNRLILLTFIPEFQNMIDKNRPRTSRLTSTAACDLKGLPESMQRDLVRMVDKDGKNITQAIKAVRKSAERSGHTIGRGKRRLKPSDAAKSIKSFLSSIERRMEELERGDLSNALKGMITAQRAELRGQVEDVVKALKEFGKKIY